MLTAATVLFVIAGLLTAPLSIWAGLFFFFLAYLLRRGAANDEDGFMAGLMFFAFCGGLVQIAQAFIVR
jgi:hypothetical protein